MGQNMFSFAELLIVGSVALLLGASAAAGFLWSLVRQVRSDRMAAARQRRDAMALLRLAEQSSRVTTGSWDHELLRRVEPAGNRFVGRVRVGSRQAAHRAA